MGIGPNKSGYQVNNFLISPQKRGYSLEAPWRGTSNEYPQHMFSPLNMLRLLIRSASNV